MSTSSIRAVLHSSDAGVASEMIPLMLDFSCCIKMIEAYA
jgi:hypothetical protein